jgi:hypothetical protein
MSYALGKSCFYRAFVGLFELRKDKREIGWKSDESRQNISIQIPLLTTPAVHSTQARIELKISYKLTEIKMAHTNQIRAGHNHELNRTKTGCQLR